MKKFIYNLLPHNHNWSITNVRGGGDARFFMLRVCQMCGKIEHKDLRTGMTAGWVDGDYVAPRQSDDVEVIQAETPRNHRGWK